MADAAVRGGSRPRSSRAAPVSRSPRRKRRRSKSLVAEATDEFLDRARRGEHPDDRRICPPLSANRRRAAGSAAGAALGASWQFGRRLGMPRPAHRFDAWRCWATPIVCRTGVQRQRRAHRRCGCRPPIRRDASLGSAGRISSDSRAWPGRNGDRLRGRADFARPPRGAQGFAVGRGSRSAAVATVSPGSPGRRPSASLAHRADLFGRLRTRRLLLCDAVHRRAQPGRRDRRAEKQQPATTHGRRRRLSADSPTVQNTARPVDCRTASLRRRAPLPTEAARPTRRHRAQQPQPPTTGAGSRGNPDAPGRHATLQSIQSTGLTSARLPAWGCKRPRRSITPTAWA